MTEEEKKESRPLVVIDDTVARLLDLQSKYAIDHETMLIYINSLNLMNVLNLIGRRYGSNSNLSLQVPAGLSQLPPLEQGAAAGNGLTPENLAGMLAKMLGGQGTGNSPPGGQGVNPAVLLNMLNALCGQNMDISGLMKMMQGFMGSGAKPAKKTGSVNVPQASPKPAAGSSPSGQGTKEPGAAGKAAGGQTAARHEIPKIMKWDQLDERKKA